MTQPPSDTQFYQHDGILLQKSIVPVESIQRFIDPVAVGVTEEYVREQSDLNLGKHPDGIRFLDKRKRPDLNDRDAMDRHYVAEMCFPYNPMPDEHDVFAYYNDIRCLSGSAGYVRIRKGFVYGVKIVWRS